MNESPLAELLAWWLVLLLPAFALAGPLRRDRGAAYAYLFTVFLHIVLAALYFYYTDLLPSAFMRGDTHRFHNTAVSQQWMGESSFSIGSEAYEAYLTQIYSFVGPSFFLGSVLTVYAFAISVMVFVRFMEVLNIQQGKGLAVLLFGGLPTTVLYGMVPMREPYQVLFFMLACYCMVRFRLSSQPLYLIAAVVFALLMGTLHKGLFLYAPFLIVIMLLVRIDHAGSGSSSRARVYLHRFGGVAVAVGLLLGISGAEEQLRELEGADLLLTATTGEGIVDFTAQARAGDDDARTAYGVSLDTSSPVRFVYSASMILIYYMFTPFPWQVGYKRDIYAFAEVVLRVACLVALFRNWRRGGPVDPQIVTLLMVVYFSMALLWAGGTFTWGTATRHHMVHQWILLLVGVPALIQILPAFARRHLAASHAGASHAGASRLSQSRNPRRASRIPHLKALVDTSSPPPRLGIGARAAGGLHAAPPRALGGGPGRPLGLTGQ